ncbi:MAG: DUF1361 domain-containing protein [Erysipelotrichaceae bacterium]|nr:DUF1361 domain-containing protein [Erysipelotrichaceae bacterium]
MHKNLRLSCVLILVTLLYSGCGLLLNTMGASLFLSWLFWNLFLAILPVLFAIIAQFIHHKTKKWNIFILLLSMLWLLFLPNACYMVTDLIYLDSSLFIGTDGTYLPVLSSWIQLFYIVSSVFLALTCGLFSTHVIQQILPFKKKALHNLWIIIISLLNGYGVYIGRFLRLNSWDILHPVSLILKLSRNIDRFTIIFSLMIALFYLVAYWIFNCMIKNND